MPEIVWFALRVKELIFVAVPVRVKVVKVFVPVIVPPSPFICTILNVLLPPPKVGFAPVKIIVEPVVVRVTFAPALMNPRDASPPIEVKVVFVKLTVNVPVPPVEKWLTDTVLPLKSKVPPEPLAIALVSPVVVKSSARSMV